MACWWGSEVATSSDPSWPGIQTSDKMFLPLVLSNTNPDC